MARRNIKLELEWDLEGQAIGPQKAKDAFFVELREKLSSLNLTGTVDGDSEIEVGQDSVIGNWPIETSMAFMNNHKWQWYAFFLWETSIAIKDIIAKGFGTDVDVKFVVHPGHSAHKVDWVVERAVPEKSRN